MARIDLEKKKAGLGWLWVLLLLLALALLLWWLWGAWNDDEPDYAVDETLEEPYESVAPAAEPEMGEEAMVAAAGLAVAEILAEPDSWIDRTVSGEAAVSDVPTDRGFWVEQDGERLFALIIDGPAEVPLHIEAGQTLELTDATVYRAEAALEEGTIPGRPLDEDTRRIAQDQEVILVVDESDIEIL